jgi:hypothetical protein
MRTAFRLCCTVIIAAALNPSGHAAVANAGGETKAKKPGLTAPRIWNDKDLATWGLPVTGVNAAPRFYSEAEYYAAPLDDFRTYPVYHPDREPSGYMDWLHQQEPKPLVDPAEIQTDEDWARVGRRVFEEFDVAQFRTDDPKAINALRDREILKDSRATLTPDGRYALFRWVVEAKGKVRLTTLECAGCHMRMEPDGTVLHGPAGNLRVDRVAFPIMIAQLDFRSDETGERLPQTEQNYIAFGVPWLPDDIHAGFRQMNEEQLTAIARSGLIGTFARFNGSPYFTTKIPDLIGVKDRRYLDATATHRNRGPEDIARYAALVTVADDGAIGPHRFLTAKQRRLPFRVSDQSMYAMARYIYALEPPANPNAFDERARRGETIFREEGCAKCHEPPAYVANKLTPADGFEVPPDHPDREHILETSVHTDPALALRTRKGTGVYKIPSLRGVWYRGLFEHSGSVKTLEEWFDAKRLEPDYVPSGWKGPGVKTRAVPGHDYGLDLAPDDKAALIAFLRTL